MKKQWFVGATLLLIMTGAALADSRSSTWHDRQRYFDEGRVVSAVPIYETYYYRQSGHRNDRYEICRTRNVEIDRSYRSGNPAATIIGGAVGAGVGSQAGRSPESQIFGAIAGGIIGGAIGHELGGRGETIVHYRTERQCEVEYRHTRRELVGYEVRYRYNGREFMTFTDRHPGRYIRLEVEVTPRR